MSRVLCNTDMMYYDKIIFAEFVESNNPNRLYFTYFCTLSDEVLLHETISQFQQINLFLRSKMISRDALEALHNDIILWVMH